MFLVFFALFSDIWFQKKNFKSSDTLFFVKGQANSKWLFQADVSSKKRTNKFDFTTCRLFSSVFLEESEDTKKTFRN